MSIRLYAIREGDPRLLQPSQDELSALLAEPDVTVWVDVEGSTDEYMVLMRDVLMLHPLLIEDAFKAQDTPKLEAHSEYIYLIVHGPVDPRLGSSPLTTADVDIFIADRFVCTHHEGDVPALAAVRELLERRPSLLAQGPSVIAHRVIDHMIDHFLLEMNEFGERLDALELMALREPGPGVLERIFDEKHEVMRLARLARHQREVLRLLATGPVPFIPTEQRPFFRDVYDHFIVIADQAETYRDNVGDALDVYLSMQSHRLNDVMKVLTLISTIMLPLTFITGLYGMNFDYMPGLHHKYGYQMAWVVMITTAGAIFVFFKRRNWW